MTADAIELTTPLQFIKGVGPRRAADLARVGLVTVEDLLYRFPLRYEDRSRLQPIASLKPGRTASVAGRILSCGLRSTRRPGFKIFDAVVDDGTGSVRVVVAEPGVPSRRLRARAARRAVRTCRMRGHGGLQLTNPQYEILEDEEGETIHTGRIVPVYEKAGSVTPKIQRRLVFDVAAASVAGLVRIPLPDDLRSRLSLPARFAAFSPSHFPPADVPLDALNRFANAGAAPADLRGSLSLPDRRAGAAAVRGGGAASRVVVRVDDRIRESARPRAAVPADRRDRSRRSRKSSTICSGRSR